MPQRDVSSASARRSRVAAVRATSTYRRTSSSNASRHAGSVDGTRGHVKRGADPIMAPHSGRHIVDLFVGDKISADVIGTGALGASRGGAPALQHLGQRADRASGRDELPETSSLNESIDGGERENLASRCGDQVPHVLPTHTESPPIDAGHNLE